MREVDNIRTADEWRTYLEENRDEFYRDLDEVADLMKNGTVDDLAAWITQKRKRAP